MADKDPEYIETSRGRMATKCRICGGSLLSPSEIKKEMHKHCDETRTGSVYSMRG